MKGGDAYIHDADDRIGEAIEKSYGVLDELRSQGVLKGIGVGMNYCAPSIRAVKEMDLDIILIAGRYSLLDQSAQDELFKECLKKQTGVMVGGVYNSGVLANPTPQSTYNYVPVTDEILNKVKQIQKLLADFHIPLTAAAIQFPLRHPAVTCVVTGSRSVAELSANIEDFDRNIVGEIEYPIPGGVKETQIKTEIPTRIRPVAASVPFCQADSKPRK